MVDATGSWQLHDTADPEALEGKFERNRHLLPAFAADAPEDEYLPELNEAKALDRAQGCLLGLAVGEAIGSAVEYLPRDGFDEVTGPAGGGPLDITAGEWTDGMAMALCLARTMIATGTVEQYDFMQRLQAWLTAGENTVHGKCVAIGDTTRTAIESFIETDEPSAGLQDPDSAGNGSLIRLAPLAILAARHAEIARFLSSKQSRATHATHECLDACELFTAQLVDALNGADKAKALRPRVMQLAPNSLAINGGEFKEKSREDVRSSAYVIDTLDAALWAIWTTDTFDEAVLRAANLGGDAAGVAAVAGQLAGALYGFRSIPTEWRDCVAMGDDIKDLSAKLLTMSATAF
ncbi:ADP-ribosylglycohydrolase family protein [Defluviimonas sp. WL0002]|uniref:ADP-ribosylglycohydrolase family protein n=1 Tax=Albidovulum marisflavi TaxID=2984159 RepID=A0ABT2ZFF7_9RHOB|nr:ADP-ribosylglycohydrolase family protein [Defluviimonas sp. WL0002]MCV2869867.1 ADP-ribosylglycohydrolase family protein [Defluviimonas sp. WL0002]